MVSPPVSVGVSVLSSRNFFVSHALSSLSLPSSSSFCHQDPFSKIPPGANSIQTDQDIGDFGASLVGVSDDGGGQDDDDDGGEGSGGGASKAAEIYNRAESGDGDADGEDGGDEDDMPKAHKPTQLPPQQLGLVQTPGLPL